MKNTNQKMSKRKLQALKLLFYPEAYPGMVGRNRTEIVFLLWENNTLGDYITWSLFLSEQNYCLRRIIWKQRSPHKLKTPETYCREIHLPTETLHNILNEFLTFDLAYLQQLNKNKKYLFIDGIEYGIYSHDQRINWHNQSSTKIIELVKWHQTTLAQFEKWLN